MSGDLTILDDSVLEALVEMAGGDTAFAARVIAAFTTQGDGLCAGLRAASEARDAEELLLTVHKLGGSSGSVGGALLHERCYRLESLLRSGSEADAFGQVDAVLECYGATCAALHDRWGRAE